MDTSLVGRLIFSCLVTLVLTGAYAIWVSHRDMVGRALIRTDVWSEDILKFTTASIVLVFLVVGLASFAVSGPLFAWIHAFGGP